MMKCTACGHTGDSGFSHIAGDESIDICPECGAVESVEEALVMVHQENETLRVLEAWTRGTSTGFERAFRTGTMGEQEYHGAKMVLELLDRFIAEEREWDNARSR